MLLKSINIRVFLIIALFFSSVSDARQPRSSAAKAEFQRQHPCPDTGNHRGKCPGWIIDHIDPLCHGGADAPSNMQWQTVVDAKVKDRWERSICRK